MTDERTEPGRSVVPANRGPSRERRRGESWLYSQIAVLLSQIRSMVAVFLHGFRRRETIQYPDEMPYLAPRFRGRIILSRDPDGSERCVACYLCAVACPVDCIALQKAEDETGRWYPEWFRINFSRCIDRKSVV